MLLNHPHQIKLVVLDVDGVVVNSPKQKLPSKKLVKVVSELQKRLDISVATGRVWPFVKPIVKKLKLTTPVVVAGGAQIIKPQTEEVIWQKTISTQSIKQVLAVFREYPQWGLLANNFSENEYHYHRVKPDDFKLDEPIFFIEQAFLPKNIANEVKAKLDLIPGVKPILARSHKLGLMCVYVLHQDTSKKEALEKLQALLNVNKEETLVVGDGENDYHLFQAAGYKVAMANAVSALKKQADLVIGSVEEDGLTVVLEKLT